MNTLDEARAAMRAIADTVHDAPALRLPPADTAIAAADPDTRGDRTAHPSPPKGRRWPHPSGPASRRLAHWGPWLAPGTAAAAVLAIGLVVLFLRAATHPAASQSAVPASVPASVPPYYVALPEPASGSVIGVPLVVAETRTGRILASVAPPHGTSFFAVTSAGDNRTFVVGAEPAGPSPHAGYLSPSLYLLRLSSDGRPTDALTRLPVPAMPAGTAVKGFALSPDGTRLAMAVQPDAAGNPGGPAQLRIYSVATGAVLRTWMVRDGQTAFGGTMASWGGTGTRDVLQWADGGRELAFSSWSRTPPRNPRGMPIDHLTIRLLNVTLPGTDAIANSRLIWSSDTAKPADIGLPACQADAGNAGCPANVDDWLITPDGTSIIVAALRITGTASASQSWTAAWLKYQAGTNEVPRVLAARTAYGQNMDFSEDAPQANPEWTNPSGSIVIGYWPAASTDNNNADNFPIERLGIFTATGYSQLPPLQNGELVTADAITW